MEIVIGLIIFIVLMILNGSSSNPSQNHSAKISNPDIPKNQKELLYLKITKEKANKDNLSIYNIDVQGLLPNKYKLSLIGALYLYDEESGHPFLSNFTQTDESSTSRVFHRSINFGPQNAGLFFSDWVPVSKFFIEGIQHPHSGERRVRVAVFYYDANTPVIFEHGRVIQGENNVLHISEKNIILHFEEPGYIDAIDDEYNCKPLMVAISMSMAMSDGSLDKSEGTIMKNWIKKEVDYVHDEKKDDLKKQLNASLESSYKEMLHKGNVNSSINKFNKIATKDMKYKLIQLCLDVLSADGVADEAELKTLEKLTSKMGLNLDNVQKMKDKTLIKIDIKTSNTAHSASDESVVGLKEGLSNEDALKFIKKEYRKWNGRFTTLSPGNERDNAQRLLDALARLRKKYEQK